MLMKQEGRVTKCFIHFYIPGFKGLYNKEQCSGRYITKESKFGAISRSCQKGWEEVNAKGWDRTLWIEE